MSRSIMALAWACLVAFGSVASAQQPPPSQQPEVTFRVEVDYVEVDAVVTDRDGNLVTDLTAEDFEVLEDGRVQSLSSFSRVEIPIERSLPDVADPLTEPDVRTNERGFEGRLYILLLDDLHTHPLRSVQVRNAAREFLNRAFHDGDLAAVVYTSGRADAGQELTSSRRLLLDAVNRFTGRKLRSATLERLDQYQQERDFRAFEEEARAWERLRDPLEMQRGHNARRALGAVRGIAEWLGDIRGRRKALLFFSEGIDYDIHDIFEARDASMIMDEVREAIAAATRGGVNVYGLDPRGLTMLGDEFIAVQGLPMESSVDLGPQSLMREVRLSQDSLRVLADNTGGFAAVNMNDLTGAFDRILRENSSYYLLGYYPTNTRRDGRFRRIEVRVTRPGLQVTARQGYVAPSSRDRERERRAAAGGDTSPELRAAMESPLPVPGLTLRAFAVPFQGGNGQASVSVGVEIDGRRMTFTERDGMYHNTLEVSILALDHEGRTRAGDRHEVQLRLRPETYQAVAGDAFRFIGKLELGPGRYQVRVAARESGGLVGTVHQDLEVTDFSRTSLAMSGIVLTSTRAPRIPTAHQDESLRDVLPAPPTAERLFAAGEAIALYTEIYDNVASPPHDVSIETQITSDDGRVVFSARDQRHSTELAGGRGGYGHSVQIPLHDLRPGQYVLRVTATSHLDRDRPAVREVPFRITEGTPDGP